MSYLEEIVMKFDVVVGNPPYQMSREDTRDDAIYNYFYNLAERVAHKYILISPARFLFNAGSTDKKWNQKMLTDEHPEVASILPASHQYDISTGVFGTLKNILFFSDKPNDGNDYMSMLGRYNGERVYRWIRRDFVNKPTGFDKYRVVLPNANGTGELGEVISTPLIADPYLGFTQTFLSVGQYTDKMEAENTLKYIKTKFARTMLGVLKVTQHNPAAKWKYVPLQNFTEESDIDWTQSISDIDQQLYIKYELNYDEIKFIENRVKPMY